MNVNERDTVVFTVAFTDENGASVIPNNIKWTLSDTIGTIINARENVVATPAESINITLTDDDLVIGENGVNRILTIESDYDSAAGSGLTLNEEYAFTLVNLVNVE